MADETRFTELLHQVRRGDDDAAAALIEEFRGELQRVIRYELRKMRHSPLYDSMDIFQAVMMSFCVRARLGQYELNSAEDLRKLLGRMARNKVVGVVRRETTDGRGGGRPRAPERELHEVKNKEDGPSTIVAIREIVEQFDTRLPGRIRLLRDKRHDGRSWAEIAAELGGTPEALRKEYERGIDMVQQEIGLPELIGG